eukprot:3616345-Rhodomonas_salina.2
MPCKRAIHGGEHREPEGGRTRRQERRRGAANLFVQRGESGEVVGGGVHGADDVGCLSAAARLVLNRPSATQSAPRSPAFRREGSGEGHGCVHRCSCTAARHRSAMGESTDVGSLARVQSAMASMLGPQQDSLPSDQRMTHGWLRSRSTMRVILSRYACAQAWSSTSNASCIIPIRPASAPHSKPSVKPWRQHPMPPFFSDG